jgi:hypothetical protein
MYTNLLYLHNILRWVILLLLLIALLQAIAKSRGIRGTSLWLLIAAHITLLLGLYQWSVGELGWKAIQNGGFGVVMKNSSSRFWAIEHPIMMILAIILITAARSRAKTLNYRGAGWLLLIALIFILAAVPWPFRDAVARPWFPNM